LEANQTNPTEQNQEINAEGGEKTKKEKKPDIPKQKNCARSIP
jgi:hypothetical protein